MEFRLDKISVPDKIQLHRQVDDVLYSDLLKATLRITKLQAVIDKLETDLRQEKVENKAISVQIKKLQTDLMTSRTKPTDVQGTTKLLEEK